MTEAVRRFKANRALDGKPCGSCGAAIEFGRDAAVCTACEAAHHAACWDKAGGCATAGCVNAPLAQMEAPAAGPALKKGQIACPHCGTAYSAVRGLCPRCKRAPTESGVYEGPTRNAQGAVAALVCGILAFFICGPILGAVAISKSNEAHKAIASDPRLSGGGMATAGKVCGIIAIVLWVLIIIINVASK